MTKDKNLQEIKHLSLDLIESAYKVFYIRFLELEEPIPEMEFVDRSKLSYIGEITKMSYDGNRSV